MYSRFFPLVICLSLISGFGMPFQVKAQSIQRLIVDVRTQNKTFSGTDDPVHLQIGGLDFRLDESNRDDFERGNTDRFELDVVGQPLTRELIRGIGQISVTKIGDSFFGGGWAYGGITIWAHSTSAPPLFEDTAINIWLEGDGDDLQWVTTLDEPGWNVPEPPAFPPCNTVGDIDTGEGASFDADCDGIPDEIDDSFDRPLDSDGDGLPDLYETQTGTDPFGADSDGDGWADGGNHRSYLVLAEIRCDDEREDIGSDEIYLTVEDVRYPAAVDLDGYWTMNDGSRFLPGIIIDSRVGTLGASPLYRTRLRLRESDFAFFEKPTDDTYVIFDDLEWSGEGTTTLIHEDDDSRYVLTFKWFTLAFQDPSPQTNDDDSDGDAFSDRTEFLLSVQDASVQAQPIAGFDGLADPERRELWVEIDASGSGQRLRFDAKQMVASQFHYHGITPRFDNGFLGGGQILPYQKIWTPANVSASRTNNANFAAERRALNNFRYALLVDELQGAIGSFGQGSFVCPICQLMIAGVPLLGHTLTAQAQPIFFMHELGHTLGLCHRTNDKGQTVSACPIPAGTNPPCNRYCGVGQDSVTAMGSEGGLDAFTSLIGPGLAGVGGGIVIGALIGTAIAPGIGTVIGAVVGGIVGGVIGVVTGAVLLADFYAREVNYDPIEWLKLRF